ncbi:MAG: hypothetical protein KUG56_00610 [Kordiimonadaceae bacterium]|nr:hypothetical protein [Kordiimonadaceae bacterium]
MVRSCLIITILLARLTGKYAGIMLWFIFNTYTGTMKKISLGLLSFSLLAFSAAGHTKTVSDISPSLHQFIQGDYLQARNNGRKAASANSLTIACRAGIIIGGFLSINDEPTKTLHGAIDDCLNALKISPAHFDAQMSLAVALSFEGKRISKTFYPKKARLLLEDLVKRYPDNATAYGALASWHSQVSAAGFFARFILSASRKKARALFHEAFTRGAMDYPLHVEYLKFMAVGSKKERQEAISVAQKLIEQAPVTALDQRLQGGCKIILAALQSKRKKNIKAAIQKTSAFNYAKKWNKPPAYPTKPLEHLLAE